MVKRTLNKKKQKRRGHRQTKMLHGGDLYSVSEIMNKHNLVQQDYDKLVEFMTYGDLAKFYIYPETVGQNGTLSTDTVIIAKTDDNKIIIIIGKNANKPLIEELKKHIENTNNSIEVIEYEDDINYRTNKDIIDENYNEFNYNPEDYNDYNIKTRLSFNDGITNMYDYNRRGIELILKNSFKNGEGKIKFLRGNIPKINIVESEIYMPKGKIEDNVLLSKDSKNDLNFAKKRKEDYERIQTEIQEDLKRIYGSRGGSRKRKTLKNKRRRRRNYHTRRN